MRLALGLGLALALAAPARAETVFPVEIVAALGPEASGPPVLVGRSGQLYAAGADRVWRRKAGGGVAVDVRAAVRNPARPAEVIVAGEQAPSFRLTGGAWMAELLGNRGAATLARGGAVPALAIGRHVYTLDKGAWSRRTSTGKAVTALWAAGASSILIATSDGALGRWDGRRLAPIRTGLAAGDPIVLLLGGQPRQVYGRSRAGRWIRIAGTSAAAMSAAADLAGFDEQAAGVGPGGELLLAGTLAAGGGRASILAAADRNRLVRSAELWPLPDGDRFAVIHAQGQELLVASRSGAVRVRAAGAWSEGRVAGDLPAAASRARRARPARSR